MVISEDNPEGPTQTVSACRTCLFIDPQPRSTPACPTCGEVEDFRDIEVAQPVGFRTDFGQPKDFDGQFEWSSRSLTPRIAPDTASLTRVRVANSQLSSGRGASISSMTTRVATLRSLVLVRGTALLAWISSTILPDPRPETTLTGPRHRTAPRSRGRSG